MLLAQHSPADFEYPFVQRASASQLALRAKRLGQVAHRSQGVGMLLAQHPPADFEYPFVQRASASQLALRAKHVGKAVHRSQGVGMLLAQQRLGKTER